MTGLKPQPYSLGSAETLCGTQGRILACESLGAAAAEQEGGVHTHICP